MQGNSTRFTLEDMNKSLFFFLLFLYQIAFTFQGVDMGDEGAHATFYQQLFNDPASVQYNFMFWLSGIIGGSFLHLFPGLGLWGLRLAGVLVTTGTLILTYNLLKTYLQETYLKLGLLLVILMLNNDPKDIFYNNVSALMYVMAAFLLFTGLKKQNQWRLLLCGVIVGLNVFNRLPNVLGLGLSAIILYQGIMKRDRLVAIVKKIFVFGAGFVIAIVGVIALMKALHHYEYFVNAFQVVVGLSKGTTISKDDDSSYGLMTLIKLFLTNYENCLRYAVYIALFLLTVLGAIHFMKKKSIYRKWMGRAVTAFVFLLFLILILTGKLDHIEMMYCFTGVALLTSFFILAEKDSDIRLLTLIGLFIMMVHPLGSSGGMHVVGQYSMWLIFPLVINYLFSIKHLVNDFQLFKENNRLRLLFSVSPSRLEIIRKYGILLSVVGCFFHAWYYPYFDKQERFEMKYSLDSKKVRGIFTTKERATPINELLHESERYIKPGDYVLAYSSIPLFHFLTDTRPYIRNSWPYLYMSGVFLSELNSAYERTGIAPVVVIQRVNTIGDASDWSSAHLPVDPEWDRKNQQRDIYLGEFLSKHHYTEVWKNEIFRIMVPGKDSL